MVRLTRGCATVLARMRPTLTYSAPPASAQNHASCQNDVLAKLRRSGGTHPRSQLATLILALDKVAKGIIDELSLVALEALSGRLTGEGPTPQSGSAQLRLHRSGRDRCGRRTR